MEDKQKKPTITVIDTVYLRNLMPGNQECVYFLYSSRFSGAMKEAAISTNATILYDITNDQAVEELSRLLALNIHFHDDDGRILSPTPLMDTMWHALILDTRLHLEFQATLPFYVHHRPLGVTDGERLTRLAADTYLETQLKVEDEELEDEESERQQADDEEYSKAMTKEAEEEVERQPEVGNEELRKKATQNAESPKEITVKIIIPQRYPQQDTIKARMHMRDTTKFWRLISGIKSKVRPQPPGPYYTSDFRLFFEGSGFWERTPPGKLVWKMGIVYIFILR
ncbi:hypothetical protein HYALB_00003003 [Hymenoscyphus albidus]|uniref:Uncharacterized protein n=1 Tax=Hymenoscyphus albidus TaxID=595503 RepID=A0A9N9QDY4_9HELO|nr:hypothetical protein HYALB_00003003 [Hymenoscyphus albidus]